MGMLSLLWEFQIISAQLTIILFVLTGSSCQPCLQPETWVEFFSGCYITSGRLSAIGTWLTILMVKHASEYPNTLPSVCAGSAGSGGE